MRPIRVVSIAVALAAACATFFWPQRTLMPTRSFPPIVGATRITVVDPGNSPSDITDPVRITSICAFINRRSGGWGGANDMYGVPVPRMRADFFAGKSFLGHFGVGDGFFESQRGGTFASRPASRDEVAEFAGLIRQAGHAAP